jgi:hypothetical protein
VQRITTHVRLIHVQPRHVEIDRRLPPWARRSNPIIRRHLGLYWKTILPETGLLVRLALIQVVFLGLTLVAPFLFDLALPTITASILLFPFAIYLYGQSLFSIGMAASLSLADEVRGDTLNLLRVTPFSLEAILASKIAAAIWRQIENLGLLMIAAALLSLPLLISQYAVLFPLDDYPYISRVAMMLGLVVSLLRMAVEPFMVGAVGVLLGAVFPWRAWAVVSTTVLWGAYFLLLNLLRFVPMDWPLRFAVDFVLPLALPLFITWLCLRVTLAVLRRN